MKNVMDELKKRISGEEFDYQALLDVLRNYNRPRDKITQLLKNGDIIRVKKGLYVFGERHTRRPFSRELLANLIYGPSYVSLDYALHYHGLIPERVESITSVTCGTNRRFHTPVGLFVYRTTPMNAYPIGIDRGEIEGDRSFLIATPEKALTDKVYHDRGTGIRTQAEMRGYLLDSLRIDPDGLEKLDPDELFKMAERYSSLKAHLLYQVVRRMKTTGENNHE